MSELSHSKKVNAVLIIFGSVAAVFVIFSLGVYVGYERAVFASGRSDNYYRDFMGGAPPGVGFTSGMPGNIHGVVGAVIDIGSSSIVVRNSNNDEESVLVSTGTTIRMMDKTIDASGFAVGESIVVIGQPDANGQIEARFVRIFPTAPAR